MISFRRPIERFELNKFTLLVLSRIITRITLIITTIKQKVGIAVRHLNI